MRCRIHTFQACSFDRSDTSPGWRLLASHGALAMPGRAAIRSSLIPAHALAATVAPFRAWRGSQPDVAGGPDWTAIDPAIRAAQSSGSRRARIGGGGLAIGDTQLCSALATPPFAQTTGATGSTLGAAGGWRNCPSQVVPPTRECAPARPQGHGAVPRGSAGTRPAPGRRSADDRPPEEGRGPEPRRSGTGRRRAAQAPTPGTCRPAPACGP